MDDSLLLTCLLVVANVLGVGMVVPQFTRIVRTGLVDGVSSHGIGIGVAMNLWWASYGLSQQLWGILPVSIVALALYLTTAARFCLVHPPARWSILSAALVVGAVPLGGAAVGGWAAAGVVVGSIYAVQFAPAVWAAWRSTSVVGIAPTTWAMAMTEGFIWLYYGNNQSDLALGLGGGGAALLAALVLIRVVPAGRVLCDVEVTH